MIQFSIGLLVFLWPFRTETIPDHLILTLLQHLLGRLCSAVNRNPKRHFSVSFYAGTEPLPTTTSTVILQNAIPAFFLRRHGAPSNTLAKNVSTHDMSTVWSMLAQSPQKKNNPAVKTASKTLAAAQRAAATLEKARSQITGSELRPNMKWFIYLVGESLNKKHLTEEFMHLSLPNWSSPMFAKHFRQHTHHAPFLIESGGLEPFWPKSRLTNLPTS